MRSVSIILGIALGAMIAAPAAAEQGKYASSLKKMLAQTAAGNCPADVMADGLLTACRDQLPKMQPDLAAAGPISSMKFIKATGQDANRVESYKVTFAKGETSTWQIGKMHDGKFEAAWSSGN